MSTETEKAAHGLRLKTAMARRGVGRGALAVELGVAPETVTNWRSGRTMPDLRQMHRLAEVLGDYNAAGDQVEVAVRASELTEDRQFEVIAFYKRKLREQQEEGDERRAAKGAHNRRRERELSLAANDEDYSIDDEAAETERST